MFESPGKITNLRFQSKGSVGQWITQYVINLESQPTYRMVTDWLECFSNDERFTKASQYRIMTIREKQHKVEDCIFRVEKTEQAVLTQPGYELSRILFDSDTALVTVHEKTEGSAYKEYIYAKKNPVYPDFKRFWKKHIWNEEGDVLVRFKRYAVTPEDNDACVYKLEFESGKVLTIGLWTTFYD